MDVTPQLRALLFTPEESAMTLNKKRMGGSKNWAGYGHEAEVVECG
jgi:hypothetical protein